MPPKLAVDEAVDTSDAGVFLLSPRMRDADRDAATHQQGALAVDQAGRTVWFRAAPDGEPITDVRVQRYQGKPVLTWWQGAASRYGIGRGEGVIMDGHYKPVATVQAGDHQTVDLHEFLLTDRGTALVTIYSRARRDLRAIGGARDAQVTQGIVQEIDVATGRVLLQWHSLDHVDPAESNQPVPTDPQKAYDYFHINSVAEDAHGDLLISARHTSAVYKVDRATGEVVWRLGGKRSDFTFGEGADFAFQHDARWLSGDTLQLFDNGAEAEGAQPASSVKRLVLDEDDMTATLEQRFAQPDGEWAESQGNGQMLDGGGLVVGWGSVGALSRFDAKGRLTFDARLPAAYDDYRAYLMPWTGRPAVPPAIHADRDGDRVTVAASWNGSTEVRAWQLLAGPRPDALKPVGRPARWQDLETSIVRATAQPVLAVDALDADGSALARSATVRVPGG